MRSAAIMAATILAATLALGQANTTPNQGSSTTTTTAGKAGAPRVLQAKSQEELKAYQDAFAKTDPALLEAAADDFAAKYPTSELRASLYIRAMNLYSQSNNTEKVIEAGEKAIADDPINPIPLVQVASAIAESTRDTDLDREQQLALAAKDAHAAIDNVDTGLILPANADPQKVAAAKRNIQTMAYDTLGMIDMNKKDYASAEKNLQQAITLSKDNPEAVLYLRLSVAQDHLQQYPQALDSANKAVQYAKDGSAAQNLGKQQQARVQKLMAAEAAGSSAPAAAPMPDPTAAPGQSPAPTSPTNTPH
jgi:tetratricopeptide (TPR) repeat protein